MLNATISVIIPTYNRTNYLPETIQSILAQTYPVSEIILIDDGSASHFREQLNAISHISPLISLCHISNNNGVSYARNYGLSKVTGDYILFLDDDDTIHPKMVETALSFLESGEGIDGVFCLYSVIYTPQRSESSCPVFLLLNHNKLKELPFNLKLVDHLKSKDLENDLFYTLLHSTIAIHSCLLRKTSIGNMRFPEELGFGEDKYFWLMLASKGCSFRLNPKIHAFIRRHSHNSSGYSYIVKAEKQLKYYEKMLEDCLITGRRSIFLVYLKLFHIRLILHKRQSLKHILMILQSPDLLLKEFLDFCKRRLVLKWNFLKYYFLK